MSIGTDVTTAIPDTASANRQGQPGPLVEAALSESLGDQRDSTEAIPRLVCTIPVPDEMLYRPADDPDFLGYPTIPHHPYLRRARQRVLPLVGALVRSLRLALGPRSGTSPAPVSERPARIAPEPPRVVIKGRTIYCRDPLQPPSLRVPERSRPARPASAPPRVIVTGRTIYCRNPLQAPRV